MHRLRFLHIPKCAGITFVTMLRLQYPRAPRFSFSGNFAADRRRWDALPADKQARIRLFTGHAPIETGIPAADTDIDIVTMLREPVERVKSLCQHVSEGKSAHLLDKFPPEAFDLDAFLDSGNEGLSNLQTKMLINTGKAASPDLLQSMTADEARARALHNLRERVTCYGIQELFDESLVQFQQRFGWRTPCYASSNRKRPDKALRFEQRHLERIAEMNRVDLAVYAAARQALVERLESGAVDPGRLRRLRAVQPLASPLIKLFIAASGVLRRSRGAKPAVRQQPSSTAD